MKKDVPAIIPVYDLTSESSNMVNYTVKGSSRDQEIFCESVTTINGWISLSNLRMKKSFSSSIEPVEHVSYCTSCIYLRDGSSYNIEGYQTIANRTIPLTTVDKIDSFDHTQQDMLPLWARTSEESAIEEANNKVKENNEKVRVSNCLKFSYCVQCGLEQHLRDLYFKEVPGWRRYSIFLFGKLFKVDQREWIEERRKQSDVASKLEEIKEEIIKEYNDKSVEWDGDLEYVEARGAGLYQRYGPDLGSTMVVKEKDGF